MINKFQQGGDIDIQQKLAQDLVSNGVPEKAVQQLAQNKELWSQLIQIYEQQGIQGVAKALQELQQQATQQTSAAKHGAKLNYIKSLKHQCAEDEELYYYKKGGKAGCGCRKKEDGGEIQKAQPGAVARFKQSRKPNPYASEEESKFLKARNKFRLNQQKKEEAYKKRIEGYNKRYQEDQDANVGDSYPPSERGKKPKIQAKSCGSKLKKHLNGGSLNRIPFLEKVLGKKE